MNAAWVVVVVQPDTTLPMSPPLNAVLDAITTALAPAPGEQFNTLGGLAYSVAIEGKVEVYEGVMGNTAVAFVPIRITIPGY